MLSNEALPIPNTTTSTVDASATFELSESFENQLNLEPAAPH